VETDLDRLAQDHISLPIDRHVPQGRLRPFKCRKCLPGVEHIEEGQGSECTRSILDEGGMALPWLL
jgi:hypothetical protein